MKILLTGATGFVGAELGIALVKKGHELIVISRSQSAAKINLPFPCEVVEGDLSKAPIEDPALKKIDAVFHLMGEPVAKGRWSAKKKDSLVRSRVQATQNLFASLKDASPKVFVSASAIGFYGDRGNETLSESAKVGEGFLAELCRSWEVEAFKFRSIGARVAVARIGIVLGREGGALAEMLPIFRLGAGGAIAGGESWMSWIHLEDLVSSFLFALENSSVDGIFNAVSPKPCRNSEFTVELGRALGKPAFLPVPSLGLKILFGEKSSVLMASQRVVPEKLGEWGFSFSHKDLRKTLSQELAPLRGRDDFLRARQYVDKSPAELFPYFGEAANLEELTPETLHFRILSVSTKSVEKNTLIKYALKIHGIPVRWTTRIEAWDPPRNFVDNQLSGPYSLWHHTHEFEPLGKGTLMTDSVRFRLPLGWPGWLAAGWWVRGDVERIFRYRREQIYRRFGKTTA